AFRLGHDDAAWAAPRFLEVDPILVKELPDPAGLRAPRPVFVSAQEQQQALATALTRLVPREAVIRVGHETTRLRTLLVPAGLDPVTVVAITERYAQQLLVPVGARTEAVQGPQTPAVHPPRDERPAYAGRPHQRGEEM